MYLELLFALHAYAASIVCPVRIEPFRGIGTIHLGDTLAAVNATHAATRFTISFDHDHKVSFVEAQLADLPDCVTYKGVKIPRDAGGRKLSQIFENCGRAQALEGGHLTRCEGISISTDGRGGRQRTPSIRIGG